MIEYQGKTYWSIELDIPGRGEVLISDTKLNEILMNHMEYASKEKAREAMDLDDTIYYFLDEDEQKMSEEKLIKYITEI